MGFRPQKDANISHANLWSPTDARKTKFLAKVSKLLKFYIKNSCLLFLSLIDDTCFVCSFMLPYACLSQTMKITFTEACEVNDINFLTQYSMQKKTKKKTNETTALQ